MFPRLTTTQFLFVVIFLLIYGLTIFWATRGYYRSETVLARVESNPVAPLIRGDSLAQTMDRLPPVSRPAAPQLSSDPVELTQQANDLFGARQFQKAAQAYRRLIELDEKNVEHYNNLGLTLQYIGSTNESLQILEKGTRINPAFPRIWLTLGFVRANAGLYDGARLAFERVITLDETSDLAKEASRMRSQLP